MKLDFRTKFILTFVISIYAITGAFLTKHPYFAIIVYMFPYILGIFDKKYKFCIKGILFTLTAFLIRRYGLKFEGVFGVFITFYCEIILRLIPGIMMGYYTFLTTHMSDLVFSLKKAKFPDAIIIPISVMFRFFSSIKQDYKQISEAMKMNNLGFKTLLKNPMKFIEFKFVPLLMITVNTADEVAISAMTRGMIVGEKRSSISNAKLRFLDYVLLLLVLFIIYLNIRG